MRMLMEKEDFANQLSHVLSKELRILETVHLEKYIMSFLAVVPYWS